MNYFVEPAFACAVLAGLRWPALAERMDPLVRRPYCGLFGALLSGLLATYLPGREHVFGHLR